MEFGYIGVHSARYSAIGRTDGNEFLLPIGPKLRRWYIDSDGLEVVGDLCYNDNLVMALERNSRFLVSTGYNSQAVVIDPKSLAKLDEVRGLGTKVRVCTVNESYYASCAEICLDGLSQTCINVWKFAADGKLGEHAKLRGSYHCPILFSNDKLLLLKIVEIVDEQKTAIAEAKVYNHKLCLFSLDSNELEKEVELSGNISEIVNYEVNEARDVVAITFLDKTTIFVDQQGQVFGTIDIVVKGTVTSATFRGDYYYFGLEPGQMVRLRPEYLRENKVSRVTVQFGQDDQFVTSMHLPDHRNIRKNSFFLLWLDEESLLLTGDEEGLYLNKLKAKRTIRMQSDISLTGCGVAVSPSGSLVGVGDFSGNANVYFFDAEELKTTLYMQANIGVDTGDAGVGEERVLSGRPGLPGGLDRRRSLRTGLPRVRGRAAQAVRGRGQRDLPQGDLGRPSAAALHHRGLPLLLHEARGDRFRAQLQAPAAPARRSLRQVRLAA